MCVYVLVHLYVCVCVPPVSAVPADVDVEAGARALPDHLREVLHCCHAVFTLFLDCCYSYSVVALFLHCCYTVVLLLLHCYYTDVTLS
jgi:hypothetical protein